MHRKEEDKRGTGGKMQVFWWLSPVNFLIF
jgi:hypothetical protein